MMFANQRKIENTSSYYSGPKQARWSPYTDNGGSVVAIAGEDFAVIGSDTRLSSGFSIHSREQPKIFKLSNRTVVGCPGCWCDSLSFSRLIQIRMKMYEQEHNKVMSTSAVAQLMATMLYYKRFFPYYISNVLAGIDSNGKGCVYTYDPVGHCELEPYGVGGSSSALLQPLLDNQIALKNIENATKEPLSVEKAVALIKDVFISASERDIYTGDGLLINIISKDGIKEEKIPLRRD